MRGCCWWSTNSRSCSRSADDQATAYLTSLTEAVRTEPRCSVVATLRADHYDRPLRLPGVGALIQDATVIVPPLGDEERRRAIIEPAHDAGLTVDDEVLRRLLAESRDSLPALQYTLFELAERADDRLSAADLADLGGLEGAIAHRAEELAASLDAGRGAGVDPAARALPTPGRSRPAGRPARRRAPLREVLAAPDAPDRETVQAWVDARLLTTDRDAQTREPVVQISHEALLGAWPRLRAWIDEERDWLRLASQARTAAGEWEALGRDDDALWRGARLDRADDVLGAHRTGLPEPVATFLTRSLQVRAAERTAAAEREQEKARTARRIRRQRSWLAAALVVVVTVAAVAWQQRQDAVDSAQRAEDRARAATLGLVTAAGEARAEDWTRSLLLAVEARRLDDSPRTQEALLATLSDPSPIPTELRVRTHRSDAMGVDPDSGAIVTKDTDGVVTVLARTGRCSTRAGNATVVPPRRPRGRGRPGAVGRRRGGWRRGGRPRHRRWFAARLAGHEPWRDPRRRVPPGRDAVRGHRRRPGPDRGRASLRVVRSLRHPEPVALISVHWAADGTGSTRAAPKARSRRGT
jgi:hypothetical protein